MSFLSLVIIFYFTKLLLVVFCRNIWVVRVLLLV